MFKNFLAHPMTTLGGLFLGLFQAALTSAAVAYTQTGNMTDWKPYAAAGAAGAMTFLTGAVMKDPGKPEPPPAAQPIISPVVADAANQALAQLITTQLGPLLTIPPQPKENPQG